jgi:hypothetical protein
MNADLLIVLGFFAVMALPFALLVYLHVRPCRRLEKIIGMSAPRLGVRKVDRGTAPWRELTAYLPPAVIQFSSRKPRMGFGSVYQVAATSCFLATAREPGGGGQSSTGARRHHGGYNTEYYVSLAETSLSRPVTVGWSDDSMLAGLEKLETMTGFMSGMVKGLAEQYLPRRVEHGLSAEFAAVFTAYYFGSADDQIIVPDELQTLLVKHAKSGRERELAERVVDRIHLRPDGFVIKIARRHRPRSVAAVSGILEFGEAIRKVLG